MRPKFSAWLTSLAVVVAMVLVPLSAQAGPKPAKQWNIYQDKLGAYTVTTAVPKGQTFIEGPFPTQAEATAALTTDPVIEYTLTPSAPDGDHGWYKSDVSLTWKVYVPNSPGKSLVVTGGDPQSITADQQEVTYSTSATAVGGSAGPVSVTIKRDATPPTIQVGPGIANGDAFEVGSVPPEPTFEASDATSGIDTSSFTGYGIAVGNYTLVGSATDFAGNVTNADPIGYTVFRHPAQVETPTAKDETFNSPGVANPGSITIPTVPGVDYFLDGVLTEGGAYEFYAGSHEVTAAAQPDYELRGYPDGGWTLVIGAADVIVKVTPEAPTKVDQEFVSPGVASQGGINILATTGVDYFINDAPADGFVPLDPGSYQVTAQAWQFYELIGYPMGGWTLEVVGIDPTVHVATEAPTATDQTAGADGFITIPAVTGVNYLIDAAPAAAGDNPLAPGDYVVTAEPQFGYALDGDVLWNLTVNAFVNPVTITMIGVNYPDGSPNPAGLPRAVMMDPYLGNGPPVTINETTDTFSYTVPVNSAATPQYGAWYSGYFPNITYGQYATMTNVPADVDVFVTVELSPSLAGQEGKFTLGYRSTVWGYPFTPLQTLPVQSLDLEATNWGAAVGGHHWMTNGVGVQWAGVTGTGSFTVTMHFTAAAL